MQIKWHRLKKELRTFQNLELSMKKLRALVHSTLFHCLLLLRENGFCKDVDVKVSEIEHGQHPKDLYLPEWQLGKR